MKRAGAAAAAGAVAALWVAAHPAGAADPSLKQLMGENFAGLQKILVALINSKYADVPAEVKLIHDHATQLTQMVPESARGDRDQFLTYAYNLRGHADDLSAIAQALGGPGEVKDPRAKDALREAAAAHYGGMVTMCVACHNRFRPQGVK
jgi:hypothetical protein